MARLNLARLEPRFAGSANSISSHQTKSLKKHLNFESPYFPFFMVFHERWQKFSFVKTQIGSTRLGDMLAELELDL